VAPDGPTDLPLQSIALRTRSAPFLPVGSGLPGVGSIGKRQRFRGGRSPSFAAVGRSSCGLFGLSHKLRSAAEASGRFPVGRGVWTTTSRSRDRTSPSKTACWFARSVPRRRDPKVLLVRAGLLSWGSKIAPPPIQALRVHSRVGRSRPFGPEVPTSRLVPPLSFHPTPTVSSAQRPAGLLHPATGHGVRHVSGAWCLAGGPKAAAGCGLHPRWRIPFGAFPSLPAVPRHRGLCPLAVGCRWAVPSARVAARFRSGVDGSLNLRALGRQEVRCARPGVAARRPLGAPLGFDPLRHVARGSVASGSEEPRRCRRSGGPRRVHRWAKARIRTLGGERYSEERRCASGAPVGLRRAPRVLRST